MEDQNKSKPQKPQKGSSKAVKIVLWVILAIIALSIVAWIYQFIKQNFTSSTTPAKSPSPSAVGPLNIKTSPSGTQAVTSGNWTLEMTGPIRETGIQTDLNGNQTGSASFNMPGDGKTANITGVFSGEGSGVVGSVSASDEMSGKMNVTAQLKNGKLHLNVTYVTEKCTVTLNTPMGSSTTECANQGPAPDPHTIDIDAQNGATASSTVRKDYGNYQYTWTENWTLKKAQ